MLYNILEYLYGGEMDMKTLPVRLLGSLLVASIATSSMYALSTHTNKSLSAANEKSNYIEKDVVGAEVLAKDNTESKTTQEQVEIANKAVEEAQAKVESTKKELEETTSAQKAAEVEATKADNLVKDAEKAKEAAEAEVLSAKTEEDKKAAQEKVEAAQAEVERATQVQKEAAAKKQAAEEAVKKAQEEALKAEAEKEAARKAQEEAARKAAEEERLASQATALEENQTTTEKTKSANNSSNSTATSSETKAEENSTEKKSGGVLTDEILKKAAEGEKRDRENYEKALKEKGLNPPSDEHTVEFHFYSTLRDLKVRRNGDAEYWDKCGKDGVNCIWFVEFSCDMNECEGFAEPGSNELSGHVLLGRRGDTKEYVMQPPKAKPGYRFKAWEIVSARGTVTQYGETGVLVSSYRAIYEKY